MTDWQSEYHRLDADARRLLNDALVGLHEKNIELAVLAAGYHPFHAAGFELVDRLRSQLASGLLAPGDITQETVWRLAEELGIETDLIPILITEGNMT